MFPNSVRWEYGPEPAVRKRGRDGARENLGESTRAGRSGPRPPPVPPPAKSGARSCIWPRRARMRACFSLDIGMWNDAVSRRRPGTSCVRSSAYSLEACSRTRRHISMNRGSRAASSSISPSRHGRHHSSVSPLPPDLRWSRCVTSRRHQAASFTDPSVPSAGARDSIGREEYPPFIRPMKVSHTRSTVSLTCSALSDTLLGRCRCLGTENTVSTGSGSGPWAAAGAGRRCPVSPGLSTGAGPRRRGPPGRAFRRGPAPRCRGGAGSSRRSWSCRTRARPRRPFPGRRGTGTRIRTGGPARRAGASPSSPGPLTACPSARRAPSSVHPTRMSATARRDGPPAPEATPVLDSLSSMTGAMARSRRRRSRNLCFRAGSRRCLGCVVGARHHDPGGHAVPSFRMLIRHGIQDGATDHTRNIAVSHSMMFHFCS